MWPWTCQAESMPHFSFTFLKLCVLETSLFALVARSRSGTGFFLSFEGTLWGSGSLCTHAVGGHLLGTGSDFSNGSKVT